MSERYPHPEQSLEQAAEGFKMDAQRKKVILEIAHKHGASVADITQVFNIMATEALPDSQWKPNPLVDEAIATASETAIAIYGESTLKLLELSLQAEESE